MRKLIEWLLVMAILWVMALLMYRPEPTIVYPDPWEDTMGMG